MFNKRRVYLIALNASWGFGYWAYNFSIFNSLQDYLKEYIFPNASTTSLSLVASFINAGSIIGALISGPFNAILGRRRTLILADILGIIAVALMLVQNLPVLLIGRILSGVVSGFNTVTIPLYLVEISPLPMCGATGSLSIIVSETFSFVSLAMGFLIPSEVNSTIDENIWRVLVCISALLNIIRLIFFLFFWKFDTPFFLIQKDKKNQANQVLSKIYDANSIVEEYKRIDADVQVSTVEGSVRFWDLFTRKYRKAFCIGLLLAVIQHFAGMSIVFVFSNDIFSRSTDQSVLYSTILGIVNLAAVIASFWLIDKFARRTLILTGTMAITILWIAFGIVANREGQDSPALKFILLVWPIFFQMSLGSLTFLYISEILPSIGVSVCVAANWTSAFIICQFYMQVVDQYGLDSFFLFCAILCFVAEFIFFIFLVETKGRTKSEIMAIYSKGKYAKASEVPEIEMQKQQSETEPINERPMTRSPEEVKPIVAKDVK